MRICSLAISPKAIIQRNRASPSAPYFAACALACGRCHGWLLTTDANNKTLFGIAFFWLPELGILHTVLNLFIMELSNSMSEPHHPGFSENGLKAFRRAFGNNLPYHPDKGLRIDNVFPVLYTDG